MRADYQAETFDLEENHWWYRARRKILASLITRTLGDNPSARLLDVGCGAGTLLRELSDHYQVSGLDLNPEAAEMAASRSGCRVISGSIPDDVPPDLVDLDALCLFDVIEHLDEDVAFLRSAGSLLRREGYLFLTVPALQWLYGQHDRINEHRRRYSRGQLVHTLEDGGYIVEWCSYFNFFLSPLLIPAVFWKGRKSSGHNFEVRSPIDPLLEAVLGSERFFLPWMRFPLGLSLIVVARKHPNA